MAFVPFAALLAFPEAVPASIRFPFISALGTAALGAGVLIFDAPRPIRFSLTAFAATVLLSWTLLPGDASGLRHFSGIGLGVLSAGLATRCCSSQARLLQGAALVALAALGVVLAGLAGTSQSFVTEKFAAWFYLLPQWVTTAIGDVRLPLPGVDRGVVNPNALGGAAVLVLPLCAGTWVAIRRAGAPKGLRRAAAAASLTAAFVLLATLSRGAWAAALVGAAVMGWRARRTRRYALAALGVVALVAVGTTWRWHAVMPGSIEERVASAAAGRGALAGNALRRVAESPIRGVGIDQYDAVGLPRGDHQPVAHAHNIFLQTALDIGLPGLVAYLFFFGLLGREAARVGHGDSPEAAIAAGAGLSLVTVHVFGLADAIALGAKVGWFQWIAAGLIIASGKAARDRHPSESALAAVEAGLAGTPSAHAAPARRLSG